MCYIVLFEGDVSLVPLRVTFSMIGKLGISGAFGVVCLYTPEIFPTTLRSDVRLLACNIYICISMGGQLGGNFLPGSLPHKFILIVTLIICFAVNKFFSVSIGLLCGDRCAIQ